jgi:agmatinase
MDGPHRQDFFAGCFAQTDEEKSAARIVFAGLADDSQSSFRRGSARAPQCIREAYTAASFNSTSESGVDLSRAVLDAADIAPRNSWEETSAAFREFVFAQVQAGRIPFLAGGDHAVSVPVIEALAALGAPVHIIQVDAHPDLYLEFDGRRTSHACVAARLLELEHVASVTQFGIRTLNAEQKLTTEAHYTRLNIFHARDLPGELPALPHISDDALVWFDFDLDGFDPAFAPGVSHPVPGGLTPRQVLNFLQGRDWNLAGMSVVELNPDFDEHDRTAILAARLLHEGMALALRKLEFGN